MRCLLLLLTFFAVLIAPVAYAAEGDGPMPIFLPKLTPRQVETVPPADPKEPPPEQELVEARNIEASCKSDPSFAAQYQCDCLGANVYSMRKQGNPDPSALLIQRLAGKCANKPGIAGSAYTQCKSFLQHGTDDEREAYCTCYAKTYTLNYERNPSDNPFVSQKRMSASMQVCDKRLNYKVLSPTDGRVPMPALNSLPDR